jgi:peptide deformylase
VTDALDWKPELLGIDGTVRPVVTAPAAVLSGVGAEVDPTDPEIMQLAAHRPRR